MVEPHRCGWRAFDLAACDGYDPAQRVKKALG
jgi:hypothetical protein